MIFVLAVFGSSAVYAQKRSRTQRVTVNLTERGYRPSSFHLQRGVTVKVTFVRKTDATCGQVIVIPDYGIERSLPLNQPVTITFRPRRTGSFNFTCGMNMLRGKIIVN